MRMAVCTAAVLAMLLDPTIARAGSLKVFSGSAVIQAGSYTTWQLNIDIDAMDTPTLAGRVTASGGEGNDIRVLVVTDSGLQNWKNNHGSNAIYSSGKVTVADVAASFAKSGTYYLVMDNTFSPLTAKTVTGELTLEWNSVDVETAIGLAALVGVLLLGALAGGIVVALWRKRGRVPPGAQPPST